MECKNKTFLGNVTLFLFLISFVNIRASLDQVDLSKKLFKAIREGENEEAIQLLGADPSVHAVREKDGSTALHVASYCSPVDVVRAFLGAGADVHATDKKGCTALHDASLGNRGDVAEILLGAGANVHATDKKGCTALHNASSWGCIDVVRVLLGAGADANVFDKWGDMPLHNASRHNRVDVVRALIEGGARVNALARKKRTALHIATSWGNLNVMRELLQAGANIYTVDNERCTPFELAVKVREEAAAKLLALCKVGLDEEGLKRKGLAQTEQKKVMEQQVYDRVDSLLSKVPLQPHHILRDHILSAAERAEREINDEQQGQAGDSEEVAAGAAE